MLLNLKCRRCGRRVFRSRFKFCSKACYQKFNQASKESLYSLNPKICVHCKKVLPYKKRKGYSFCSSSCAASATNNRKKKSRATKKKQSDSAKLAHARKPKKLKTAKEKKIKIKVPMPEATRQKIGRSLSLRGATNPKCKWYKVNGVSVQGTWERNVAQKFQETGVNWVRPTTSFHVFKYEMDGKTRFYTPDFFLIDFKIYLEIKGYWWGDGKKKMESVINQHPDRKILIVEEKDYERILNGEQIWL